MVKGCGRKTSKVAMNIFSVVILLIGAAVIAVTAWALANNGALPTVDGSSIVNSTAIIPIALLWAGLALGIVLVLCSVLGFFAGNGKRKHCFSLTVFIIIVILAGLAVLVIGIFIYLASSFGTQLETCPAALTSPAGDLDTCSGVPTIYSVPFTAAFIETYNGCGFDNNAFCTDSSAAAEACLAYYNSIFPGQACDSVTYAEFFVAGVQYMTPWAFVAGIVIICCGGVVTFMTVPAFCLCCTKSKEEREVEEVVDERVLRQQQKEAAAVQQAGGTPVTGASRYV